MDIRGGGGGGGGGVKLNKKMKMKLSAGQWTGNERGTMKTAATTLLVVCVVVFCVISVAWLEGIFSSTPNTAWRGDGLIRVPLHRPPVRIKLGSYASLVARILHAQHLTPSDRDDFAACQDKHKKFSNEWRLGACVFVDPASRSEGAVALVSLPGSGNTWLRGLLERATGVCTGKSGVFYYYSFNPTSSLVPR